MLKRRCSMKQSGFKRNAPVRAPREERARPPITPPADWRIAQPVQAQAGVEKTVYVRSDELRAAYRRIACQNCMRNDGTVCCAHANWAAYGKGKSIKASDDRGASLCFECHSGLDQGRELSREERRLIWEAAHRRTVLELVARGFWPSDVPVPPLPEANGF